MHPHPPMPPSPFPPYHHWYTDVEPAYEKPAECECHFPPMPDNCVCVTEEDANNWNAAYDTVSAISAGLDMQKITSAAKLLTSADYWNQSYTAVKSHSALWNQLPEVSSTLASEAQSALWLIDKYLMTSGLKHDDSLTGDGVYYPLGIALSDKYDELYEQFEDLYKQLTSSYNLQDLYNAMAACKEDLTKQIGELSGGHIQNYELILQLMGVIPNSGNYPMVWVSADMQSDKPSSYTGCNTLNWMYYSTYNQGQ